jgi:hypothetical protein
MVAVPTRSSRMLVAIAVIGLCGLAMLRGSQIVRFSIAEALLDSDVNRYNALRPWLNVPGLAYTARTSALSTVNDWNDKSAVFARRDQETEILTVKPLSADFWLLLADMRRIAGDDPSEVVDALTMSMLIGRNEGYLMAERGLFAMSIWEMLPPEIKQRGARDLAMTQLLDIQKRRLQTLLSEKSEHVREEIKNDFAFAGVSKELLAELGLTTSRAPLGN